MKVSCGSFDLPDAEASYLKVSIKINNISLRSYVSECVRGNLLRMRNLYRDRIQVEANRLGITWEECFNLYLFFDPPFSQDEISKAKNFDALITKEYGHTQLGNEE